MARIDGTMEACENGIELRLTLAAITGGYRICQSFLGEKDHVERRAANLVPALRQTVGVLFSSLETDFDSVEHDVWFSAKCLRTEAKPEVIAGSAASQSETTARNVRQRSCGVGIGLSVDSLPFHVGGAEAESPAWVRRSFVTLRNCGSGRFTSLLQLIEKSVINRDHIIQALAPLFRGRAFTFLVENRNTSANDVANNIEGLCLEFERLKPYLLELWKSKE